MENAITNQEGLDEARALLRPRFANGEFWLLIADKDAFILLERIAAKYYRGASVDDWAAIPAMVNGGAFAVVAARKRLMMNWQLGSLLRQIVGIKLSDREVAGRDLLITTAPQRLDQGTHLAAALFDDPDAERGDIEDVLTVDGGPAIDGRLALDA